MVADRIDETCPFAITYTLQNAGAPLVTLLGTSGLLNLLSKKNHKIRSPEITFKT